MKPTLVILAAGMGSRYGGLKQMDPVGPNGEMIIDYSIYDAIRAGFGKVVFIIKDEIAEDFRALVGDHIEKVVPVEYCYQRLSDLPAGYTVPESRVKPWGTAHAVYSCRDVLDGPFAVINADDFYGADAFEKVAAFLQQPSSSDSYHCCMAGYYIENTLTENGHVARGVCSVNGEGYLTEIHERTRIERRPEGIAFTEDDGATWNEITPGTVVSMNFWGFPGAIMQEFEPKLREFLDNAAKANPEKSEFFLPLLMDELIQAGRADAKVLDTAAKWYGVTYRADKETVENAIVQMIREGAYPERLWA